MANMKVQVMEQATRDPKPRGFLSAMGGPEFLVAQFFTILATVIGVYLAGYVGFQRTMEYDRYVKAQSQSDLLTAMHAELKHNIARLRKFDERLPADVGTGVGPSEWPRLRLYIWQAAAHSASVFDTPPQALADMQTFYEDVGDMMNEGDIRQQFKSLTGSNTYDRTQFKARFSAKLKFAETSILPALEKATAEAGKLVSKYSGAN